MNFKNWEDYKNKNKELNLDIYCKSHLKEMDLKPTKNAECEIHKVYTGSRWKEFKFYNIKNTQKIKHHKKSIIRDLDITIDNLCESLYVINKSAKKSRDSKQQNYYKRNHGIVSKCKQRQENLYEVKNNVIDKMIDNNLLSLKGYHIQNLNGYKNYLLLYTYNNYSFHIIENKKCLNFDKINYLGEITDIISAERTKKTSIKFNEAIKLLNKYLEVF